MKRILRRLFFKRKRRYYNNSRPTWSDYTQLQDQVFKLESKMSSLARSSGMVHVQGIYMSEKEAKKYKGNGFICH